MNKKRIAVQIILILFLLYSAGEAFVPKAPHLLYLIIDKIKQPVGIQAFQTKKIINYKEINNGYREITERLLYSFPGNFRSDITEGNVSGFTILSEDRFVKVADGVIVSTEKQVFDAYADILLYRDYKALLSRLTAAGVDTQSVMLKRYKDTFCYVVGASPGNDGKPFCGLWVEKDTFFPLKYTLVRQGWTAEFYYENWQRVSKTWYPMRISVFLDDQLYAVMDVKSFDLKRIDTGSFFNVDTIMATYPDNRGAENLDETARQVNEIEKGLRDFNKMFD